MILPYDRPQDVLTGGDMKPRRKLSNLIAEIVFYAMVAGTMLWAAWLLGNLMLGRTP